MKNKCSVGFVSLGCAKNLTDTESMIGILKDDCIIENDPSKADVIIINTCAFIDKAKEESISTILEMAQYGKKLIVCGCLSQRYKDEVLEQFPEVSAVVGTTAYDEIRQVIDGVLLEKRMSLILPLDREIKVVPRVLATPKYSAYLKIADGCDNNCTYCVIPSLRGPYKSRSIEDIVSEATALAKNGVSELNIIAQDTTYYGKDLYGSFCLPNLLSELSKIDGIVWIRLHYCYPENITDELIEEIKINSKVCKYIDIPLQHICDDILKKMLRKTSKQKIVELLNKIRQNIPNVTIRSTFIAGFPGETQEQHMEMLEFVKWAKFDRLGVFAYSQEEDTPAAKLKGQIDEDTKNRRVDQIMKEQQKISLELNKQKIGTTIKVLCEHDGYGRSQGNSLDVDGGIYFSGNCMPGQYIDVKITQCKEYDLIGEKI